MNVSFQSKVILVVGGTGGLGRAVSLEFLRQKANDWVPYRSQEEFAAMQSAAAPENQSLQSEMVVPIVIHLQNRIEQDVLDTAFDAKAYFNRPRPFQIWYNLRPRPVTALKM
jgi:NAD(P)-dependent dehydrogenase (short-subunit alcohol dehydrogenase family)